MKETQERVDLMFLPQPWLFESSACCFEMCSLAFHVECRPKHSSWPVRGAYQTSFEAL
jgi:hypothetical protein